MKSLRALSCLIWLTYCLSVCKGATDILFDASVDSHQARSTSSAAATVPITSEDGPLKYYTELYDGGANPLEKDLVEWLYKHGFVDAGIARNRDYGTSGRGMYYTRDVRRGEELFVVPAHTMIYTSNPHIHPVTKKILRLLKENFRMPGKVADDFELTEMALIVMFEKRNPQSFWRTYLSLIQFPMCPAFFPADKLSALEYNWLKEWSGYFLSDAVKNFRELMQLPQFELLRSSNLEDEFKWAVSTVLQRSFDWGPDSRREYVMVPYLDMINHSPNVSNNYYYSGEHLTLLKPSGIVDKVPVKHGMVIAADADRKAGEPVEITYSPSSNNIQLLLQYGFVVPDNINDYVVLQLMAPVDRPDFRRVIHELGGVIGVVEFDAKLPLDFVKAVNLIMFGKPQLSADAYRLIQSFIEKDLKAFSTTLEEDQKSLSTPISSIDYSVISYRVEAKKLLHRMLEQIEQDIETISKGETPNVPERTGRRDWPMRHIIVEPSAPKQSTQATTESTDQSSSPPPPPPQQQQQQSSHASEL